MGKDHVHAQEDACGRLVDSLGQGWVMHAHLLRRVLEQLEGRLDQCLVRMQQSRKRIKIQRKHSVMRSANGLHVLLSRFDNQPLTDATLCPNGHFLEL